MLIVYWNTSNKHVRIHRPTCRHIKKNGGEHNYNNGGYFEVITIEDAYVKAKEIMSIDLIDKCKHCKP